jgi:hypothetical protein
MKKLMAVVVLGAMLVALAPVAAHAHGWGTANAALALAAFSTFAVLTAPFWAFNPYPPAAPISYSPVYATPPAYYAAEPVSYTAQPAGRAAVQREVIYPHGRHVLYGDGVTTAYRWVWIPNPPPPPAAVPAPPSAPAN